MIDPRSAPTLLGRDELLKLLAERRDRSVFWDETQLAPSEALRRAEALAHNARVRLHREPHWVGVDTYPGRPD